MKFNAISRRTMTGIGITAAAMALPATAHAQLSLPLSHTEVQSLPIEYQSGPAIEDYSETTIGADGVETITRTRRIENTAAYPGAAPGHTAATQSHAPNYDNYGNAGYAPSGYAPASSVFQREEWIDECEDRTNGRGNREKGGIIGGLLGAIAGGIIGNRVSSGERLGGTLIGLGTGGIAGVLLGGLIGGGRDSRGNYDCEAALDGYLSQYAHGGPRVASRVIAAPAYQQQQQHGHHGYSYAPPQQIVYVPVEVQQQQRVIVRETVREEVLPSPARPAPRPAPPRYIKGN